MTKQQRGELQSGRLQKGKKNDKSKKGEIVMKGSMGTVITDFLGICNGFIGYLEEKYGKQEVTELLTGGRSQVTIQATFYPEINDYLGRKTLQIVVMHYR